MRVKDMRAILASMPDDAEIYATDDGTAHLVDWDAHIESVTLDTETFGPHEPMVRMEFEGQWLRNAVTEEIEQREAGAPE